jgi:hypothetical protein
MTEDEAFSQLPLIGRLGGWRGTPSDHHIAPSEDISPTLDSRATLSLLRHAFPCGPLAWALPWAGADSIELLTQVGHYLLLSLRCAADARGELGELAQRLARFGGRLPGILGGQAQDFFRLARMLGKLAPRLLHISPLLGEPAIGFSRFTSPLLLLAVLFAAVSKPLPCLAIGLGMTPEELCCLPSLLSLINRSLALRRAT